MEGLRAVAVLAVVADHAGVAAVGGGFVGVDVFFVVSGFLITGLLWAELAERGRVSLPAFYARRVRRLLPAAALVLVVTAAAAAVVLPPLRARAAVTDAFWAGLYAANYRFAALRTDYLTADAPPSPVQHYWSLGVEEQFYLLWPVLLAAAALAGRRRPSRARAAAALAGAGVASLALSVHLTRVAQPWAFFSLPTRAWELAAGGLVALAVPGLRRLPAAAPLGWAGLAAVLVAATGLDRTTPYPGTAALLPVAGTAVVLAAGAASARGGPVLLLGRAPLRFLGRLSYSWYLWHWPVLVLAAAALDRPLRTREGLLLAAAAAALAYGTLRLVEDPVRFSARLRAPGRSLATGVALTAAVALAAAGASAAVPDPRGTGGPATVAELPPVASTVAAPAPDRRGRAAPPPVDAPVLAALRRAVTTRAVPANLTPPLAGAAADKAPPFVDGCHLSFTAERSPDCAYGDRTARTTVVLLGDSHATQWFPALERIATARHWRLVSLTKATCPPLRVSLVSPVFGRDYVECTRWRAAALARIRAEHPVAVVLGVARHYAQDAYDLRVYGRPWLAGLAATVRDLRAAGAAAVVLGPTPKPTRDVPDCLAAHLADARACAMPAARAVDAAGLRAEQAAVTAAGGAYVDVSRWICAPASCPPVVGQLLVYRDDNHLTTGYPRWLAPVLAAEIDRALHRRRAGG